MSVHAENTGSSGNPRGTGPAGDGFQREAKVRQPRSETRPIPRLDTLVLLHLGALLLLATWYFGGGSERARWAISAWGSFAAVITLMGFRERRRATSGLRFPVAWLWPLAALNLLVLASVLNPSFSEKVLDGESLLAHTGARHPAWPSTAHVATSLRHLWLFDAVYLSAFNLLLIGGRSPLRRLLRFAVGNAVLLATLGTLQKFLADGLYFGAFPSPNARYFATFVYGNHWAAFAVLAVALAGGLFFRQLSRGDGRPGAEGRMALAITGILLIAVTPLVAGSRAGTLMMLFLLLAFGTRVARDTAKRQQRRNRSLLRPVLLTLLCGAIAIGGSVWLGRESLEERMQDTRGQIQDGALVGRRELYRDTWSLVTQQPVFGWGLGSYGKTFLLVRPRPLEPNRQYERSYADAHSDWLQALAEVGFVGAALFALTALVPVWTLRKMRTRSPVVTFAAVGCGLIATYALVEFPFGNPAVVIMWWICFFAALQYARLEAVSHSRRSAPA